MVTINFDFDGTLYCWDPTKSLEEVGNPDYPRFNQLPQSRVIVAARRLAQDFPGSVRIASAVLSDECAKAKLDRISRDISDEVAQASIFTVFGEDKAKKMLENSTSKNCVGIKVYNNVNGTKGTWDGYSVHANSRYCYNQLKAIITSLIDHYDSDVNILIDDFSSNLHDWEDPEK